MGTVSCGERESAIVVDPHSLTDLAPCGEGGGLVSVDASSPLLALELLGDDSQRAVGDAECRTTMSVPLFACRRGTATAAVPNIPGASYSWVVEGATLVSGAGTSRISIALTDASQATLTCTVVTSDCTSTAAGVIGVRDPLVIGSFDAPPSVDAQMPVTLNWTYDAASEPASQLLTGDVFAAPVVLPRAQRSYTFVPGSSGSHSIELLGSYAIQLRSPQSGGRRRAAGPVVRASACADARASARVDVRGCVVRVPNIVAPSSIEAGSTFEASVLIVSGETAHWNVTNGTLVSQDGGRVMVRADQQGDLDLRVRVERDASCFAEASTLVAVKPRSPACAEMATARIEVVARECVKGTIRATFTGRPPFRGRWSDGVAFETELGTLTREVTGYAEYSISEFRDGNDCPGNVTETALFDVPELYATLEVVGGSCTSGKIVAHLTGTPPFNILWYLGDLAGGWMTTNEKEIVIEPKVAGGYWIAAMSDSLCADRYVHSDRVDIIGLAPVLSIPETPACAYWSDQSAIVGTFDWGRPPYTVVWADGVVTKTEYSFIRRDVPPPVGGAVATYEIVRASTADCEAVVPNKRPTVTYRQKPLIDNNWTAEDHQVCPGRTGSMHLANASDLPAIASVQWSMENGEIVGGQGTPVVTYRALTPAQSPILRATAVYPDGACSSSDQMSLFFPGEPVIADFRFDPSAIRAGETSTMRFTTNGFVQSLGFNLPAGRSAVIGNIQCTSFSFDCGVTYQDTQGAGTVPVMLDYTGHCVPGATKTISATLVIEP